MKTPTMEEEMAWRSHRSAREGNRTAPGHDPFSMHDVRDAHDLHDHPAPAGAPSAHGSDAVEGGGEQVEHGARPRVSHGVSEPELDTHRWTDTVQQFVLDRPLVALSGALVAGFVVGRIMRR